jgi:hypothetical protein
MEWWRVHTERWWRIDKERSLEKIGDINALQNYRKKIMSRTPDDYAIPAGWLITAYRGDSARLYNKKSG